MASDAENRPAQTVVEPTPKANEPRATKRLVLNLTPRDEQLFAILAIARYLTTEQIHAVLFPGRTIVNTRLRLYALAGTGTTHEVKQPYIEQGRMRDYDGRVIVYWALSALGYSRAARTLNNPLLASIGEKQGTDKKDHELRFDAAHSAKYIEHILRTNDLFTALLSPAPGQPPQSPQSEAFRWIGAEGTRLSCKDHKGKTRLALPDAVIELPRERRRIFIEYETGDQPLVRPDAEGSGTNKLTAYDLFMFGWAEQKVHWYDKKFGDNLRPEVLFVTPSAARKKSLTKVVATWRKEKDSKLHVTVHLLEEAIASLRPKVSGAPSLDVPAKSELAAGPAPSRHSKEIAAPPPGPNDEELAALRNYISDLNNVVHGANAKIRANETLKAPLAYPASWPKAAAVLKKYGLLAEKKK